MMNLFSLIAFIIISWLAYVFSILPGPNAALINVLILSYITWRFFHVHCDLTLDSCSLNKEYFKNKVTWITGASSGIGEALSFQLASFGAKLILSARNEKKLNAIKQKIIQNDEYNLQDKDILVLPLDLSKLQVQKYIYQKDDNSSYQQILKYFSIKSIDILINNAGIVHDSLSDDIPIKDMLDVFNVNLISPAILTSTVLCDMYRKNNFGHIINISSCTSLFNPGALSIYAATKNGLNSLSRVYQTEMKFINKNVNCTLCVLGSINTGIDQRIRTSDGKVGGSDAWLKWGCIERGITPSKCANLICNAASNKLKEAWISKNPVLLQMYAVAYFPYIYRYFKAFMMRRSFPPFMDAVKARK